MLVAIVVSNPGLEAVLCAAVAVPAVVVAGLYVAGAVTTFVADKIVIASRCAVVARSGSGGIESGARWRSTLAVHFACLSTNKG